MRRTARSGRSTRGRRRQLVAYRSTSRSSRALPSLAVVQRREAEPSRELTSKTAVRSRPRQRRLAPVATEQRCTTGMVAMRRRQRARSVPRQNRSRSSWPMRACTLNACWPSRLSPCAAATAAALRAPHPSTAAPREPTRACRACRCGAGRYRTPQRQPTRSSWTSCVRCRTSRSRVRCSASAACCSTDLIGTKRIAGTGHRLADRLCIASVGLAPASRTA